MQRFQAVHLRELMHHVVVDSWDEWLPCDRLRKMNAETLELKSTLEAEYSHANKRKGQTNGDGGSSGRRTTLVTDFAERDIAI